MLYLSEGSAVAQKHGCRTVRKCSKITSNPINPRQEVSVIETHKSDQSASVSTQHKYRSPALRLSFRLALSHSHRLHSHNVLAQSEGAARLKATALRRSCFRQHTHHHYASVTMAEAVGLVASIATLAKIVVKTGELTLTYKHAPRELRVLRSGLIGLESDLRRLEEFCTKVPERYLSF